jgi:hypothetical protein
MTTFVLFYFSSALAGVGSTLLAATHRRRRAIGSEWNPTPNAETGEIEPAKWYDVAVRRLRGEEAHPSNEQPSLFRGLQ